MILKRSLIPYVINAIKANALFFTVHYIVQNNRIVIVDEFSRIMPDRRWGDGLHQAIEAKENYQFVKKN
jgi:preprotein translocase subunit SecA